MARSNFSDVPRATQLQRYVVSIRRTRNFKQAQSRLLESTYEWQKPTQLGLTVVSAYLVCVKISEFL